MSRDKRTYLIIPFNQVLNICDLYLKNAMDNVAISKGYKNHKFYIRKEFGCSGNSIKNMTKKIIFPLSIFLDHHDFPTKDSYRRVKKIDLDNFSKVIKAVINEYAKIAPPREKNDISEHIKNWNLNPKSYLQVLCHPVFWGFNLVNKDEKTANFINRNNNAISDYKKIINDLSINEVEINK